MSIFETKKLGWPIFVTPTCPNLNSEQFFQTFLRGAMTRAQEMELQTGASFRARFIIGLKCWPELTVIP